MKRFAEQSVPTAVLAKLTLPGLVSENDEGVDWGARRSHDLQWCCRVEEIPLSMIAAGSRQLLQPHFSSNELFVTARAEHAHNRLLAALMSRREADEPESHEI